RAEEQGEPGLHGTADFMVGLSELRRERNDLDAATDYLLRAQELARGPGATLNRSRWNVMMARIKESQGDLDGALAYLNEAERLRMPEFFPNVRPIAALRARVRIRQGQIGDALGWARDQNLSTDDDLSYLREFEHITLARLLLARQSTTEALDVLHRILDAAEAGGRMGSVIELLILQALAQQVTGNTPAALLPLERALTLAEPEGYARVFLDEGPPMTALLATAAQQGIAPNAVRQLLPASDMTENMAPVRQDLIEPLSDREFDVLRLLATTLDGPDIARELNISLNTMRTHTKNIYSKLGVNNRREAVIRAAELDLLSRSRKG
ncbi:MAG TPA: LuxR C-terminal-related transcriptional regulator, partial [Thermomicrobiales bacterium]|nr:LuxR C-terminal-related transcriptional regulator [Thermomicrobiales bacterium]